MNLSVIIITLGRLETLKRCVAALQRELADGDEIGVGTALLLFRVADGAATTETGTMR